MGLDRSYLCVPQAIKFREDECGGEDKIRENCFRLARDGGNLVAQALGTEVMHRPGSTSDQCCFTNIRLPLPFDNTSMHSRPGSLHPSDGPGIAGWIGRQIMIPTGFCNGAVWVRLNSHVYLDMEAFRYAANVLQKISSQFWDMELRPSSKPRIASLPIR